MDGRIKNPCPSQEAGRGAEEGAIIIPFQWKDHVQIFSKTFITRGPSFSLVISS